MIEEQSKKIIMRLFIIMFEWGIKNLKHAPVLLRKMFAGCNHCIFCPFMFQILSEIMIFFNLWFDNIISKLNFITVCKIIITSLEN